MNCRVQGTFWILIHNNFNSMYLGMDFDIRFCYVSIKFKSKYLLHSGVGDTWRTETRLKITSNIK